MAWSTTVVSVGHLCGNTAALLHVTVGTGGEFLLYLLTITVWPAGIVVPLTPRVRLVRDQPAYVSMEEVFSTPVVSPSVDPDRAVVWFKKLVMHAAAADKQRKTDASAMAVKGEDSGNVTEDARVSARSKIGHYRTAAFKHMLSQQDSDASSLFAGKKDLAHMRVPSDILLKYISLSAVTAENVYSFKLKFTRDLAILSLLEHALSICDVAPHKLLLARDSGRIICAEWRPSYSVKGKLEQLGVC